MEGEFGETTFNMAIDTLKRISGLISSHHQYRLQEFYKGNPLHYSIILVLDCLNTEVRPHLKEGEKETADSYVKIFFTKKFDGENLIVMRDGVTRINKMTYPLMREWTDWLMEMLYTHKLLTAVGEDPGDVIE